MAVIAPVPQVGRATNNGPRSLHTEHGALQRSAWAQLMQFQTGVQPRSPGPGRPLTPATLLGTSDRPLKAAATRPGYRAGAHAHLRPAVLRVLVRAPSRPVRPPGGAGRASTRPPSTTQSRGRQTGNRKPGTRNPMPRHPGANRNLGIPGQGHSGPRRTPSRRDPGLQPRSPKLPNLAPLTTDAPPGWMSCRPARTKPRAGSTRSGPSLTPAASTPPGLSGRPRPSRRPAGRRKRLMRWTWSCKRSGRAGVAGVNCPR